MTRCFLSSRSLNLIRLCHHQTLITPFVILTRITLFTLCDSRSLSRHSLSVTPLTPAAARHPAPHQSRLRLPGRGQHRLGVHLHPVLRVLEARLVGDAHRPRALVHTLISEVLVPRLVHLLGGADVAEVHGDLEQVLVVRARLGQQHRHVLQRLQHLALHALVHCGQRHDARQPHHAAEGHDGGVARVGALDGGALDFAVRVERKCLRIHEPLEVLDAVAEAGDGARHGDNGARHVHVVVLQVRHAPVGVLQVCQLLQHALQQLVVHQDLVLAAVVGVAPAEDGVRVLVD
mmetsp:Transcript_20132/g.50382  ORF Transcript_20132/g.50382 Transcript_20132/m.50382 type:complete len:290 (+) Transcript_20132:257-1126(+)